MVPPIIVLATVSPTSWPDKSLVRTIWILFTDDKFFLWLALIKLKPYNASVKSGIGHEVHP